MRWEYLLIETNLDARDLEHRLDELGDQGWELVQIEVKGRGARRFYFKRRLT